jgi:uncharacterized repeat protein (TIGR01451 family)
MFGTGFVAAAEIDDSSLFVEAFAAYQKKDYLLAIEKIRVINQVFPDTPLRDVTLLLLARSGLKSGDNELAAKAILQFNSEFATSPLKATTEEELQRLGIRWQKGEKLLPVMSLRDAAQKVRNEQMVLEKSAAAKIEQERLAKEQAGQEAIMASINISGSEHSVGVGQRGAIPFEVANLGKTAEDFLLETNAPPEYEAMVALDGLSDERLSRVAIGTAAPIKGKIMFRMPPNKVDGYKATLTLRVISEKYHHLVQTREAQIITAAPLVRVVAKPEKQRLAQGEQTRYRITVLNVGTLPAQGMTVRVLLPAQIEFLEAPGGPYLRETTGAVAFRVEKLETGKLAEFTMDVKIRQDSLTGQELRSKVEVVHDQLQTKEIFTSVAAVVQGSLSITAPSQRP